MEVPSSRPHYDNSSLFRQSFSPSGQSKFLERIAYCFRRLNTDLKLLSHQIKSFRVTADIYVTVLAIPNGLHRSFAESKPFIVGAHIENPCMNTLRSEENCLPYTRRGEKVKIAPTAATEAI